MELSRIFGPKKVPTNREQIMQSLVKKFCSYLKRDKKPLKDLERGGIITLRCQQRGAESVEIMHLLRLSAPGGNQEFPEFLLLGTSLQPQACQIHTHFNGPFKKEAKRHQVSEHSQQFPTPLQPFFKIISTGQLWETAWRGGVGQAGCCWAQGENK